MWRASADERWRTGSWRRVIAAIARKLADVEPDEIAFYISGQLLTEDYYAVNKLAKGFLGTNNVDSNSRLCMSSAVAGYTGALGSDGPPPSYADIDEAECLFLVGSNAAACHPIVWNRIRAKGAFLIVADPRRTPTAEHADLHLPVRPGTDLPLLNAMLHVLERDGLLDRTVPRAPHARRRGRADDRRRVDARARGRRSAACPAQDIVAAAHRFGVDQARDGAVVDGRQPVDGRDAQEPRAHQPLPGHRQHRPARLRPAVADRPAERDGRPRDRRARAPCCPATAGSPSAEDRAEMRRFWDSPGIAARARAWRRPSWSRRSRSGGSRSLWIVATNPVVSQPDAGRFAAALQRADLVICQDAYFPTETAALAHVLLPAAQWPEKDGTMTNSERRVSLVQRALDPPGEALPDWEIFARVGRALGHREAFPWRTAAAVHDEFVQLTEGRLCDQSRHLARAAEARGPAAVAVPDAPTTPAPSGSTARAASPRPTAARAWSPTPHTAPADAVTPDFPLVLTTGRVAAAVAHDDPHRQVALAAGGRAAPVPRAAPRRRGRRRGRREGPRALAARRRRRCASGSATRCRRASPSRRSTGARCTWRPARAR